MCHGNDIMYIAYNAGYRFISAALQYVSFFRNAQKGIYS